MKTLALILLLAIPCGAVQYQLLLNPDGTTRTDYILRVDDGANIPTNPNNVDYQNYLIWVSSGNVPLPPQVPTVIPNPFDVELSTTQAALNSMYDVLSSSPTVVQQLKALRLQVRITILKNLLNR